MKPFKKPPFEYTQKEYEFMNSLSAAVLEMSPTNVSRVIKIWLIAIIAFIVWASFAQIDEITKGDGKAIPYGQNQLIQNLEGGIVDEVYVKEGQIVKADEVILKIKNEKSVSTSKTNEIKYQELEAKRQRLYAEANELEFNPTNSNDAELNYHLELNKKLYASRMAEFGAKYKSFGEQIEQKKQELVEAKSNIEAFKKSLSYVSEEISMTEPMVKEGIKSKVDFLKLQREANEIKNKIDATQLSLPRLKSAINEYTSKREEAKKFFINNTKKELNEVSAELSRIKTQQIEYSDQIERTMVKSPVDGIVQKLYVHTLGGVIKPGEDLVEIVPTNKKLILEIKIKPSDIAFIHPGAKANVKISAYDYAIHGGLVGKVIFISPDTITDKQDNTFYIIHIETEKSYLGTEEHPLQIIPGMTVNVDIVTGKKSVMQYILKPILKTKQYVFTER